MRIARSGEENIRMIGATTIGCSSSSGRCWAILRIAPSAFAPPAGFELVTIALIEKRCLAHILPDPNSNALINSGSILYFENSLGNESMQPSSFLKK